MNCGSILVPVVIVLTLFSCSSFGKCEIWVGLFSI